MHAIYIGKIQVMKKELIINCKAIYIHYPCTKIAKPKVLHHTNGQIHMNVIISEPALKLLSAMLILLCTD